MTWTDIGYLVGAAFLGLSGGGGGLWWWTRRNGTTQPVPGSSPAPPTPVLPAVPDGQVMDLYERSVLAEERFTQTYTESAEVQAKTLEVLAGMRDDFTRREEKVDLLVTDLHERQVDARVEARVQEVLSGRSKHPSVPEVE